MAAALTRLAATLALRDFLLIGSPEEGKQPPSSANASIHSFIY